MEELKKKLLENLQEHITCVQDKVSKKTEEVKGFDNKSLGEIKSMSTEDQSTYMSLRAKVAQRVGELEHLHKTPFFVKFEIDDGQGKKKIHYVGKHQFTEESIYSWVAPIASLRFENPGSVSFKLPNGLKKIATMTRKERYMIVDGRVLFFAAEDLGKPLDLIYQEHFTTRKSEFALPEIVAQMEKAQDQVIRAHHRGSLVISGPAGSGKTTLALHRVAYLTQAPDTAHLYPAQLIIVFVQDNGTKEYFSKLLPGLGINNVTITTFSEWAFKILALEDFSYTTRFGNSDEEKDVYEYQKIKVLREGNKLKYNKNPFTALNSLYDSYFSDDMKKLFEKQKTEKKLDRFDVTILLKAFEDKFGRFETSREYQKFVGERLVSRVEKKPVEYSLMVIDEFQNYLPEQLQLLKRSLQLDHSMVYVGDMAQQVHLGTIKQWHDIDETISAEKDVRLLKVYRNTKKILEFVQSLGYNISIPEGIKEGPEVTEKVALIKEDEIEHIKGMISQYDSGMIGILAKDEGYLSEFKDAFTEHKNVHVLTMHESQGVEFDLVCIVGISNETFKVTHHTDVLPEHLEERKRMQKDLLYVALTRAITELHILGTNKLKDILR